MNTPFFICNHCKNIIAMIKQSGIPVHCCGEKMQEMIPGTTEGAQEKHIPVYEVNGNQVTVSVGQVHHPMTPEHFIEWVCLESQEGLHCRRLKPNMPPQVSFALAEGETVQAVYAFCNLHSLWKAE